MPPQSRDAAGDSLLFVIVGICCEQAPAPPFLILDVLPQIPNDPTVFHKGSSKYTQFFGSNCGKGKMRFKGKIGIAVHNGIQFYSRDSSNNAISYESTLQSAFWVWWVRDTENVGTPNFGKQ